MKHEVHVNSIDDVIPTVTEQFKQQTGKDVHYIEVFKTEDILKIIIVATDGKVLLGNLSLLETERGNYGLRLQGNFIN